MRIARPGRQPVWGSTGTCAQSVCVWGEADLHPLSASQSPAVLEWDKRIERGVLWGVFLGGVGTSGCCGPLGSCFDWPLELVLCKILWLSLFLLLSPHSHIFYSNDNPEVKYRQEWTVCVDPCAHLPALAMTNTPKVLSSL